MLRLLMIVLLISIETFALKVPKPYSAIAAPIYRDAEPALKLAKLKAFRSERTTLQRFGQEALQANKDGFAVQRSGDKKAAKAYIATLRDLQKQHIKVTHTVKKVLTATIKRDYSRTFNAIVASNYSTIQSDPGLRKQVAAYTQTLKQRRIDNNKRRHAALRSSENLEGTWNAGEDLWRFEKERLTLVQHYPHRTLTLEGRWKITKDLFSFQIDTITHQRPGGHPHSRAQAMHRTYALLKVSETGLTLRSEEDGTIELSRSEE